MINKIKLLIAIIISIMPINAIRVNLYRLLFGYKIKNSKIGFATIININSCKLNNANIGSFNIFTGPFTLVMEEKAHIGFGNTFRCGKWVTDRKFKDMNFKRALKIGKNSSIDNKHYFDIAGLIDIDEGVFISGNHSQFWTHGGDKRDNDITIGKNCYIGSGVMFAPGSGIADNSIVAMGSIVTKKYKKDNTLISPPAMRVLQFDPNRNPMFN